MVGSALVRALRASGHRNLVLRSSKELDLRDQNAVHDFDHQARPSVLGRCQGGRIRANSTQPADFLHDNLAIQTNVIEGSRKAGVDKLLFWAARAFTPSTHPSPFQKMR